MADSPLYVFWENERVEKRLSKLSRDHRVAFAAACAQHTFWLFEELPHSLRPQGLLDLPMLLLKLWDGLGDGTWRHLERRQLDLAFELVPPFRPAFPGAHRAAMVVAEALGCAHAKGSLDDAMRAADEAYGGLRARELAKIGHPLGGDEAAEVETQSVLLMAELEYQGAVVTCLEEGTGLTKEDILGCVTRRLKDGGLAGDSGARSPLRVKPS